MVEVLNKPTKWNTISLREETRRAEADPGGRWGGCNPLFEKFLNLSDFSSLSLFRRKNNSTKLFFTQPFHFTISQLTGCQFNGKQSIQCERQFKTGRVENLVGLDDYLGRCGRRCYFLDGKTHIEILSLKCMNSLLHIKMLLFHWLELTQR